jgi:hypothetical protein
MHDWTPDMRIPSPALTANGFIDIALFAGMNEDAIIAHLQTGTPMVDYPEDRVQIGEGAPRPRGIYRSFLEYQLDTYGSRIAADQRRHTEKWNQWQRAAAVQLGPDASDSDKAAVNDARDNLRMAGQAGQTKFHSRKRTVPSWNPLESSADSPALAHAAPQCR